MRRALFALLLAAAATASFAARPLTTEDASILDDKRCQVEAWIDRGRDVSQAWLAPACNFGGSIEWQAGIARTREAGRSFTSATYAQAKGILKEIDDASPWGAGWVVGVNRDPPRQARRGWKDPYALLPGSVAVGDALLHANIGWSRNRAERRDTAVWGAAVEIPGGARATWVAEAFGEGSERPFVRAGARIGVVKDVFDIDVTFVSRPGGAREERYICLGLFWQSGRFLP